MRICPRDDGHLQATGRDARGRKQYRYHARWREWRDETKYHRMIEFAKSLPQLRRRVRRDLAEPGLPRRKLLATIVRLLEATRMRVGNEEYARRNGSFGLTTLRDRQVEVDGGTLRFHFRGKGGALHRIRLDDARLARIVRRSRDLPGYELFQYLDEHGAPHRIDAADVNDYLRELTGRDFTAKDFRTWAGTVLAFRTLRDLEPCRSRAEAARNVLHALDCAARELGNRRAICRKCYVHPAVIEHYLERAGRGAHARPAASRPGLSRDEAGMLALLEARQRRPPRTLH